MDFYIGQRVHPSYTQLAGGRTFGVGVVEEVGQAIGVRWSCGGFDLMEPEELAPATVDAELAWVVAQEQRWAGWSDVPPRSERSLRADVVAWHQEAAARRSRQEVRSNARSAVGITENDL